MDNTADVGLGYKIKTSPIDNGKQKFNKQNIRFNSSSAFELWILTGKRYTKLFTDKLSNFCKYGECFGNIKDFKHGKIHKSRINILPLNSLSTVTGKKNERNI